MSWVARRINQEVICGATIRVVGRILTMPARYIALIARLISSDRFEDIHLLEESFDVRC